MGPEARGLAERLAAVTACLETHAPLWRERAFVQRPVAWEADHPEVVAWLDGQPTEVFLAPGRPWLATAPATVRGWARAAETHGRLPELSQKPFEFNGLRTVGVPGRKQAQVACFAAPVLERWPAPGRITDWCAGKAHLGRALAHQTGAPLQALEWQGALCEAGRQEAVRVGVLATFHGVDVRTEAAWAHLTRDDLVVALHACGGLHTALLRAAVARGVAGVALAPCCYNQPASDRGQPLSRAGAAAGLALSADDLDLLHRQAVNARAEVLRRSRQAQHWRLAFDALLRAATGVDAYRPMPPFPDAWLALPFPAFCARLAERAGIDVPGDLDADAFLPVGARAYAATVARDAIRGLFAAPLEAWLVLDRALWLAEAGWAVEVGTFCAHDLTPRNALILGRRTD